MVVVVDAAVVVVAGGATDAALLIPAAADKEHFDLVPHRKGLEGRPDSAARKFNT